MKSFNRLSKFKVMMLVGIVCLFVFSGGLWAEWGPKVKKVGVFAPDPEYHVRLSSDDPTGRVEFIVKGWWCSEKNNLWESLDKDVLAKLKAYLKLSDQINKEDLSLPLISKISGIEVELENDYKWDNAFNTNPILGKLYEPGEEVEAPRPGETTQVVENYCWTEDELKEAWAAIRDWYLAEGRRRRHAGKK